MASDAPNLVLGAAWRLDVADVHVFVESLRRHYRGEVMLLVTSRGSEALLDYLRSKDVTPVWFDCPYWMVMNVQLGRYIRYQEILRGTSKQYARILMSDVSDVLFQSDPFARLPDGEMHCFLEAPGRTIGQCPSNTLWIQQIFGPAVFERMKGFEISCSGTTIGTQSAILQYIDLLLAHARPEVLLKFMEFRGHDQGIHNFLLRTGAMPNARLIPNGRHVFTLGAVADSDVFMGADGKILTPDALCCPIVHQYNYRPAVLARVRSAYGLPTG